MPNVAAALQVADEVYISLGRVLTISGRTIKDEAQVDPSIAQAAGTAVQNVLDRVRGWVGVPVVTVVE